MYESHLREGPPARYLACNCVLTHLCAILFSMSAAACNVTVLAQIAVIMTSRVPGQTTCNSDGFKLHVLDENSTAVCPACPLPSCAADSPIQNRRPCLIRTHTCPCDALMALSHHLVDTIVPAPECRNALHARQPARHMSRHRPVPCRSPALRFTTPASWLPCFGRADVLSHVGRG